MPRGTNIHNFRVGDYVKFVPNSDMAYNAPGRPWLSYGDVVKVSKIHDAYVTIVPLTRTEPFSLYWAQVIPADADWVPPPEPPAEWEQDPLKPRVFTTAVNARKAPLGTPRTEGMPFNEALALVDLSWINYGSCCGHMILQGFWGFRSMADPHLRCTIEEVKQAIKKTIEAHVTGIVTCVLVKEQYDVYHEILEELGFKLLSKHRNHRYPAPHDNYLFGFTYDSGIPTEKAKTFG